MSFLGKAYALEKAENLKEFFGGLGPAPGSVKGGIENMKYSIKIEKDGDSYTCSFIAEKGNKDIKFQDGVEFEHEMFPGFTAKSTINISGNTITQVSKSASGKTLTIKREYSGDKLVETLSSNFSEGTAKIYYTAA